LKNAKSFSVLRVIGALQVFPPSVETWTKMPLAGLVSSNPRLVA
jgi:hypothetical protein